MRVRTDVERTTFSLGITVRYGCSGYTYGERGDNMHVYISFGLVRRIVIFRLIWKKAWSKERCDAMGPIYK